jgi:hypothetical protein
MSAAFYIYTIGINHARKQIRPMLAICSVKVYEKAGLLGPRTVLAHGVHLTDSELEIIRNVSSHSITVLATERYMYSVLPQLKMSLP